MCVVAPYWEVQLFREGSDVECRSSLGDNPCRTAREAGIAFRRSAGPGGSLGRRRTAGVTHIDLSLRNAAARGSLGRCCIARECNDRGRRPSRLHNHRRFRRPLEGCSANRRRNSVAPGRPGGIRGFVGTVRGDLRVAPVRSARGVRNPHRWCKRREERSQIVRSDSRARIRDPSRIQRSEGCSDPEDRNARIVDSRDLLGTATASIGRTHQSQDKSQVTARARLRGRVVARG